MKIDEDQQGWYPVTMVMDLIDIAEKHGRLEADILLRRGYSSHL